MLHKDIEILKKNNRHNSLKTYNTKLMYENTRDSLVFFVLLKFELNFHIMIELVVQFNKTTLIN
jgi:hypothetical protein